MTRTRRPRSTFRLAAAALSAALVLSACGGPSQSPEARIKALISRAEKAAEDRDVSVFKDITSDQYHDRRGFGRREILRLVQAVFLQNRQIHLLTVVRHLEVKQATAHARVLVAMAGRPIDSPKALFNMRARLMRFEVTFALEGDEWRVRSVDWHPAAPGDFL
ncbi:MAG: hypothetical protein WB783_11410 [Arenicellales bacterium]